MATTLEEGLAERLALAVGGAKMDVAIETGKRSREVKYWRMCQRPGCPRHQTRQGWITLGPTRRTDRENYSFFLSGKHMEELPDEYGVEVVGDVMVSTVTLGRSSFVPILSKGGIKEFPAAQIISLGWHRLKVLREPGVVPQSLLDEIDEILSHKHLCEYGCISPHTGEAMEFMEKIDFSKHLKVYHKDAAAPEAVGKQMAKVMDRMVDVQQAGHGGGFDSTDPDQMAKLMATVVYTLEKMRAEGVSTPEAVDVANGVTTPLDAEDLLTPARRHSRISSGAD